MEIQGYSSKTLDHLGLVAGMCQQIGISQIIDEYCGSSSADQIVSDISRGVIGQINSYLTVYEQSFDTDRTQARWAAEVTALYMQILLPDLELRLDATARVKIENALQDLVEASEQSDQSKAQSAQQTIAELISEYENELI